MALLTSVALLLATLTPPPLQHAHAGGDAPHSHATIPAVEDPRHDGHCHHGEVAGHSHDHSGHSHRQHDMPPTSVRHTHLSLLFFDFTLPHEEGESESDDRLQLLPVARSASSTSHSPSLRDSLLCLDDAPLGKPYVSIEGCGAIQGWGAMPETKNLLCDSARCARTGVLLV